MPWGVRTVEEQRAEFLDLFIRNQATMARLCREFGISRKTGYKWLKRYQEEGNLSNQKRGPKRKNDDVEAELISLRNKNPAWGAKKIYHKLNQQGFDTPCIRTINNILKRNDLISPEESKKHTPYQRFQREKPNELWQADFKGDFRLLDNTRCYPLTIIDDCSRFAIKVEPKAMMNKVQESFMAAFMEFGMPDSVLTDNGAGFAGFRKGHIGFELWLMDRDILPMHGRFFHPQTQGKVERFNRTLNDELITKEHFLDLENAQAEMQKWRIKYNSERPHEALDFQTPNKIYTPSERKYIEEVKDFEYSVPSKVRKVSQWGYIKIGKAQIHAGTAYANKYVMIAESKNPRLLDICYRNFSVKRVNIETKAIESVKILRIL